MRRRGFIGLLMSLPFLGKTLPEKKPLVTKTVDIDTPSRKLGINWDTARTGRLSCKEPNISSTPQGDSHIADWLPVCTVCGKPAKFRGDDGSYTCTNVPRCVGGCDHKGGVTYRFLTREQRS